MRMKGPSHIPRSELNIFRSAIVQMHKHLVPAIAKAVASYDGDDQNKIEKYIELLRFQNGYIELNEHKYVFTYIQDNSNNDPRNDQVMALVNVVTGDVTEGKTVSDLAEAVLSYRL